MRVYLETLMVWLSMPSEEEEKRKKKTKKKNTFLLNQEKDLGLDCTEEIQ